MELRRSWIAMFVLLLLAAVGVSAEGEPRPPGSEARSPQVRSFPPDLTNYIRQPVAGDANPTGDVRGAFAPSVFLRNLVVSNTDPSLLASDTPNDGEPSIAINPQDPNEIVILAFSRNGEANAPLWHSTDGGNTWSKLFTISDPNASGIPCDQAPDWGNNGILAITFLGCDGNIYTGTTVDPTQLASWNWADDAAGNAEPVNETGAGNSDQPWLLVNADPANLANDLVHNAYDDFDTGPNMQVVSDDLQDPTSFEVGDDQFVGASGGGGVNPGHRQAKDVRTGYIYSGWQVCTANCNCAVLSTCPVKTIDFMLNRSTDGGATWSLNASATGIVAATNDSIQPWPKYGTVNALLGGIIHLAVDPTLGHVYYVYGDHDGTNQRLSIRRFQDDGAGNMVPTFTNFQFTPAGKDAAIPSVAVASTGTVGVFYYTFDGFSSDSFPIFSAWLALSDDEAATFTHKKLLTFLSSAKDAGYVWPGPARQRVLGDYVQMKTLGRTFYGTFTGNGVPFGRPVSNHDPYFFKETVGPIITIEAPVDFGNVCVDDVQTRKLEISNTGFDPLVINSVTKIAGDPDVTLLPNPTTPLTIQPGSEVGFDVQCDGATFGAKTATIRINSNDPDQPIIDLVYTCNVAAPDIDTTIASGGSFGQVCLGDDKDLDLTIHNAGGCALTVTGISSSTAEFEVGAVQTTPLTIAGGDSVVVPIQFDPAGDPGTENADITIASNDPDTPNHVVAVTGESGAAVIETFIGDSGAYGNVCVEAVFKELPLTIQNNGDCPLDVDSVTLTGTDPAFFQLPSPTPTPTLEPLNSVVIPVRFTPTDFTVLNRSATVRVASRTAFATTALADDDTAVSGSVPPPDINVPAAGTTQEFGNVCAGENATMEIPVCNTGACNLNVASATINCDDFTIVGQPFPSVVSPDFCIPLTVQYTPTEEGTHTCQLTITSNDPDENPVLVTLTATTPTTSIDVPESLTFRPEVVSSVDVCESKQPFPISNNSLCPIEIQSISVFDNAAEYGLEGVPSFPILLPSGHVAGEGDLRAIFGPDQPLEWDRSKSGVIRTTYVSDSVTGATTDFDSEVCGEGVLTGARVLVTHGGSPVSTVDRIQIQRVVGNRNRRPQLDTVAVVQNVQLQSIDPDDPVCADFQFHQEYGGVSNPIQLLPGFYQVTATIRVGNRKLTKTVGFSVNSCDFNPSVIVTF